MPPRISRLTVALALPITLASCDSGAAPFNDSITAEELRADLEFLASDEMQGRLVGTAGIDRAANFIASRFQQMGLTGGGAEGSFFQSFDLSWFTLGQVNRIAVEGGGFAGRIRELGDGFYPLNFSASGSVRAGLVFAGFGIREPRLSYDDYAGEEVLGKVVIVLEREPGVSDPESPFDGIVTSNASTAWRKALAAQELGAVGVLFVRDIHNRAPNPNFEQSARSYWPDEPRRIERFSLYSWMEGIRIPALQISAELAERLVAGSGQTLQQLAESSETSSGLGVVQLPGPTLSIQTTVVRRRTPARNVVALVEGSDPNLRDEVVIVTAHHDHNGQDGEDIFNGADDDGSGIVGLLQIAEAYAEAAEDGRRPDRTVLFAAWDAEERGLLGAWYYTVDPLFPLENTVAVLNMDMIGRNEEVPEGSGGRFRGLDVQTSESNANAVNILGQSYTADLGRRVEAENVESGLDLRFRYDNNASQLLRRSDHWPFLQSGVPAIWFHTGLHPDYHTPNDIAELIEYEKMERISRLVHRLSWSIANSPQRPRMDGPRGVGF